MWAGGGEFQQGAHTALCLDEPQLEPVVFGGNCSYLTFHSTLLDGKFYGYH